MSKRDKLKQDYDPSDLPQVDINYVDQAGYGNIDIPESARMIAEPFSIMNIVPDVTQPRKIIPSALRANWNGNPGTIGGLLMKWKHLAEIGFGVIPVQQILEGNHSIKDLEAEKEMKPVTEDFLAIVSLAASIKSDGLLNPITISDTGAPRKLTAGERRYFSYQLLNMFFQDEGYDKIPAFQKKNDVWEQAAENGARRPLNAIGIARQLALLLMDIYKDEDGADFQPYHQLVVGENDQPFYAQVKNGYVYSIKSDFAQRIIDVTGLTSSNAVVKYRRLLDIPSDVWLQADAENWTEGGIRSYLQEMNAPKESRTVVRLNEDEESLTAVKLDEENVGMTSMSSAESNGQSERERFSRFGDTGLQRPDIKPSQKLDYIPESPLPGIKPFMLSKGVKIINRLGEVWTIEKPAFGGNQLYACINARGTRKDIHFNQIKEIISAEYTENEKRTGTDENVGTMPALSNEENLEEYQFSVGDKVRTRTGHVGQVVNTNGALILVSFGNYSTNHKPKDLTLIYQDDESPLHEGEEAVGEGDNKPQFIFEEFDEITMPLFSLAKAIKVPNPAGEIDKQAEIVKSLVEIGDMTTEHLFTLAKTGVLEETFQAYYDNILILLEATKHHVLDILNSVETYALNETGQRTEQTPDD